jgi:hypothetical protein
LLDEVEPFAQFECVRRESDDNRNQSWDWVFKILRGLFLERERRGRERETGEANGDGEFCWFWRGNGGRRMIGKVMNRWG